MKAKPHLLKRFEDDEWRVRKAAIEAFGVMPADDLVDCQSQLLDQFGPSSDWDVRASALEVRPVALTGLSVAFVVSLLRFVLCAHFALRTQLSLDISSLFVDPSSSLISVCQVISKFPAQELANVDPVILTRLTHDLNVDVRQAATRVLGKQNTAIGPPT